MATHEEVARHLDLGPKQVGRLVKSGVFTAGNQRGSLDLDFCRKNYIHYLRERAQKKGAALEDMDADPEEEGVIVGGINVSYQDARKKQYDADIRQEKLLMMRKENAPVWLISMALSQVSASLAAALSALPNRLRLQCPDLTVPQIEVMQKEIARVRNECTDIRPDLSAYVVSDPDGGGEGA